jgi:S1-C subfamily serine protease
MLKSRYRNTAEQIQHIREKDPELNKEYEEKLRPAIEENLSKFRGATITQPTDEAVPVEIAARIATPERMEEAIVLGNLRPVLIIRDNKIVPEFAGPDVSVWKDRLMSQENILNAVIPAVGRIEVSNNAIYKWVGTGWMVDTDVIVTNRHVASLFCSNKLGFEFKIGFPSGTQAANVDFLEEYQRVDSLEFLLDAVIWMSENDGKQPDVAFMRVKRAPNGLPLPKPIELAESVSEGDVVVTIGYPARDPNVPDQDVVLRTFGDVYDKKRLAPGEIANVSEDEIEHNCSTLGGNSGSPVIQLSTGKALGLHFAGLFMQANFAVPAPKIKGLLDQLRAGTLPRLRKNETNDSKNSIANKNNGQVMQIGTSNKFTIDVAIPLKITVEIGGTGGQTFSLSNFAGNGSTGDGEVDIDKAVEYAKNDLRDQINVVRIGKGYRFRRGWITDEKVVVVEVTEKQSFPDLKIAGKRLVPQEYLGIGVDVRTAGLREQLEFLGVDSSFFEAVPTAGLYKDPPHLKLDKVNERMRAIFHVSPDSGFPNLKRFFERIKGKLTATMYEWEAPHISDAIESAIKSVRGNLKMVTQKTGTEAAVDDMKVRLGRRFEHVWASVGKGRLIPKAYHIKVATRDEEEVWLSSGNWKNSNQADIDPARENSTAITPLREHNREWHVIIENTRLAKLFEDYINWDFEEAQRVPVPEAVPEPLIEIFVPEAAFVAIEERRVPVHYFDPLEVDKVLDIQPLLTPDRNSHGERMFLQFATDLIDSATRTIDIENQSFTPLDENADQFDKFLNVLKRKQDEGVNIRIIFRDPREFSWSQGTATLQDILSRIKELGLDTDNIKVQKVCHTKAILIDSETDDNAVVMFGSHNLTNMGALFNRDASLIVKDREVATYFQQIFNFDWEVLASQTAEESVGGVRIARRDESTPAGFRRVSLSEFMRES